MCHLGTAASASSCGVLCPARVVLQERGESRGAWQGSGDARRSQSPSGALGEVPQVPRAFLVLLSGAWAPAVGSLGTMGTKSSSWRSPERQNYSAVKSTILSPWRTSSAAGLSRRAQDCFNSGYSEQKRLLAPCPPLAGALAPGMGLAGAVSEPRPRPPPRIPSPQCCCSSAGARRGWTPPGLCPGTGQCPFHPADLATSQGGCGSGFKEFESSLVCVFFFFLSPFFVPFGSMSKDCRACSASPPL